MIQNPWAAGIEALNNRDKIDGRGELDRLAPALRRYARALVARESADPQHDADCLARDTLARAERADRSQNSRVWLYATLTMLNRARARSTTPRHNAREREGAGVSDALTELPLDCREAYLLVTLEGFSHTEAGDILGVSRATVAARVARARLLLETRLDAARPLGERGKKRLPPYLRLVT